MKENAKTPLFVLTHFPFVLLLLALFACSEDKEEHGQGIYNFSFKAQYNENLKADVHGVIDGNEIKFDLQEKLGGEEALVATFNYRGSNVKIGTTDQVSNVTINDFTKPLVYTVTTNGGAKIDYTVTVTSKLSRIPRVYVETAGKQAITSKETYVKGSVRVEDPDELFSDGTSFFADMEIRGRGNSTWGQPKKPYRIKMDEKASILGLGADKNYAMLANYFDKTLLRNLTAFEMSRIAGIDWTPGSISVDFYLNGAYKGVYTITEHVKVSKERVNLDLVGKNDNEGEALTGDYFLELDFHFDEPYKFKTDKESLPIMFKDPEEPTTAQYNYVKDFFNKAEQVLYSDDFLDPEEGYRKYIDMESFLKYYLVQELAKNVDGNFRGSCYLSLRRNGKIEVPLIWDFDIAFGNAEHIVWEQHASSAGPEGWYLRTCAPWFDRFFKDPQFTADLKARWNELKPQFDKLPTFVEESAARLDAAQRRNFGSVFDGGAGWDINEVMWPNYIDRLNYQNEVAYLVGFLKQRIQWLDTNINNL